MDKTLLEGQLSDNSVYDTYKEEDGSIDIYAHVRDLAYSCPSCGSAEIEELNVNFNEDVVGTLVEGKFTRIHYTGVKRYTCKKCGNNFEDDLGIISAFDMKLNEAAYRYVNIVDGDIIKCDGDSKSDSIGYWESSSKLRDDYDVIKTDLEIEARVRRLYKSGVSKALIAIREGISLYEVNNIIGKDIDDIPASILQRFKVKLGGFDYRAIGMLEHGMNVYEAYESIKAGGYCRPIKDFKNKMDEVRVSMSTAYRINEELKEILWFDLFEEVKHMLKLD